MFDKSYRLAYWQLLLYGIHVGHSFKNSIFYSAWLVFTYRQNILIINLYKTILGFKNGYVGFDKCCKFGNPIWFINLDRSVEIYVNFTAKQCGEFAYTTYWIHGMISNWAYIANTICKLSRFTKDAWKGQFKKLEMDSTPWKFSRWSWPRSAMISSVSTSSWPTIECTVSKTPCTGIIDTDISGNNTNIATPGNDDSVDCIVFYNTHVSQYILEKKYGYAVTWLKRIRNNKRFITFKDWLLSKYINDEGDFDMEKIYKEKERRMIQNKMSDKMKFYLNYKFNKNFFNFEGTRYFFAKNHGNKNYYEKLDIYEPEEIIYDLFPLLRYILDETIYLCKLMTYILAKNGWRSFYYVRKYNLSNKVFKLRFLVGSYLPRIWNDNFRNTNFLINRFRVNRFYKTFLRRSKFRNNKFILKFLKFFYISKYMNKRGFLNSFSANFMKVSSFAQVSFSFAYRFYKKNIFSPMITYGNNFKSLYSIKKINFLYKWLFFKKGLNLYLRKIIYNNSLSKNIRFLYMYKVYSMLKRILRKRATRIYSYFNYYLSFWYYNREEAEFLNSRRHRFFIKKFKALKNSMKVIFYVDFFYKSIFYVKKFKNLFLEKKINLNNNIINKDLVKHFKILSLSYRKLLIKIPLSWIYSKYKTVKKDFNKFRKFNFKNKKMNDVILKLKYYDRFKPEAEEEVRKLIVPLKKNYYIENVLKGNWYNSKKYWKIKLRKFIFSKRIKKIRNNYPLYQLRKLYMLKYNMNFNFFQITKNFYDKEILIDHDKKINIFNKYKEEIEEFRFFDTEKINSNFLIRFNNTLKRMNIEKILKYKISYFKKFNDYFNFLEILKSNINFLKNKMHINRKKIKKYKGNRIFYKIIRKISNYSRIKFRVLKKSWYKYINLFGHKFTNLKISKVFTNFVGGKSWVYNKKHFFMDFGFYYKNFHLTFGKIYPKSIKKMYITINDFRVLNEKKKFEKYDDIPLIFTYCYYIRFFSLYNKYLIFKAGLQNFNYYKLLQTRSNKYKKDYKKLYWS